MAITFINKHGMHRAASTTSIERNEMLICRSMIAPQVVMALNNNKGGGGGERAVVTFNIVKADLAKVFIN